MKPIFRALFPAFAAAFFAISGPATAQSIETPAEYAVIMDFDTGEVLFAKDAQTPTAPASMSKLMTLAIVFEKLQSGELKLSDEFYVSEKAWRMQGSKMFTRVDTTIPLEALLRGIIIQSGNDACVVIAEHIAGTEDAFAQLMNQKAQEWGLNNSVFANSTGWPDPNQKMSTLDLAKLARKIIHDYPQFYEIFSETEFTWEGITQQNRNQVLGLVAGADGLKTGHTEESGYGLVASAKQNGERRIVVVNGLNSESQRKAETARLLRTSFDAFATRTMFRAGDIVGAADVFRGEQLSVPLLVKDDVRVLLPRENARDVKAFVVYDGPVKAPVAADQEIGRLRIEAAGRDPAEYPLYAAKPVGETGFLGKVTVGVERLLGISSAPPAVEAEPEPQG